MDQSRDILEVFLQPGELHFGEGRTRIRTLLGSCVAISVWHPRRRIGGLCHYMLPTRGHPARPRPDEQLDGRYGDEAMAMFLREMAAAGTRPDEYEAKLFGGGRMFAIRAHAGSGPCAAGDVPCRNVEIARGIVARHGLKLRAEHLGGAGHRNVIFEIWSGDAYLRFWGEGAEQRRQEAGLNS